MCGLVGMLTTTTATDKQLALFSNLLFVDKIRGEHATGIAKVNPWRGTVAVHKKAMSATQFLGLDETVEFLDKERGRIYMGHNRYATLGDKTKDEFAHPFTVDHVTLVHNGGVDRWTMNKLEGFDDPAVVVDSHMVACTIAKEGIEAAIGKLSGAFALIWWDQNERTLNFIRNKERPLWMAELNDGTLVWASEKEFLDFFVLHKKSPWTYKHTPSELPVNLLVQFKFTEGGMLMNTGKPVTKKLEFKRVPDPDPTPAYGNWYSNYNNNNRYNNRTTPNTYDAKANALLQFWRADAKVGDRIEAKVTSLEDIPNNSAKVNVWAYYEGMDVVVFFIDRRLVEGATHISGIIMNCHEATVDYGKMKSREPRITLKAEGLMVAETKAALVSRREPAVIGLNTFPLKVQGHTFQRRDEFTDFVSTGCSMCGNVPTHYNIHNKDMAVYGTSDSPGTLNDCEFICGACINESNKEPKSERS